LLGDNAPDAARVFAPASDPFADAAELGGPPARTELSEYIDDTDMRFVSNSGIEGLGLRAGSGRCAYLDSSAIIPGESLKLC